MNWKTLTLKFSKELNDSIQQQHHAAQFLALVGRHLIPQEADDSNTNMEYQSSGMMLLGNTLPNGMRIALQLTDLEIGILDKNNDLLNVVSLNGRTKKEVFEDLKKSLSDLEVDVTAFSNILHYKMPEHDLDKDDSFKVNDDNYFIENAIARNNAKFVINEVVKNIEKAEAVKIWPHHFDTGSFIPVSTNDTGELSQSIGVGFAIPDSMVNEPYYYLSFWSEQTLKDLDVLKPLDAGEWMTPDWNGAVLKLSDILMQDTAEKQFELVKSFYDQGIEIVRNHLTNK